MDNQNEIVKGQAKQHYYELLNLPTHVNKTTPERKEMLLAKIERVACNDHTITADIESEINLLKNDEGAIVVDLFAH